MICLFETGSHEVQSSLCALPPPPPPPLPQTGPHYVALELHYVNQAGLRLQECATVPVCTSVFKQRNETQKRYQLVLEVRRLDSKWHPTTVQDPKYKWKGRHCAK